MIVNKKGLHKDRQASRIEKYEHMRKKGRNSHGKQYDNRKPGKTDSSIYVTGFYWKCVSTIL